MSNGIVVGQTANVQRTPAWLYTQLKNIFGSNLNDCWLGDDVIVNDSNIVTSWPARVGATLLPATAARFTKTVINNKIFCNNAQATTELDYHGSLLGTENTILTVATATTLPLNNYRTIFWTTNGQLEGTQGGSTWYAAINLTYTNGVNNGAINSGLTVYEGQSSANLGTSIQVGGYSTAGGARNWLGNIGCVIAIDGVISATNRTRYVALLKQYYNFY